MRRGRSGVFMPKALAILAIGNELHVVYFQVASQHPAERGCAGAGLINFINTGNRRHDVPPIALPPPQGRYA
jgi:hypothetical protein